MLSPGVVTSGAASAWISAACAGTQKHSAPASTAGNSRLQVCETVTAPPKQRNPKGGRSCKSWAMRIRTLPLGLVIALAVAAPASAATRTETSTSGDVTATFTYDYKKSSFGTYDFSNLHVTIDRAGIRMVDEALEDTQCNGCSS